MPVDHNQKAKLLWRARAPCGRSRRGVTYVAFAAKTYAVFAALLMGFHNGASGRCFPSYERIQEAAGCCRATVAAALQALEESGLLTVLNRLVRVRWRDEVSLSHRTRVMRTSNCYAFPSEAGQGAKPSEFKLQEGTGTQVLNPDLFDALARLQRGIGAASRPCQSNRAGLTAGRSSEGKDRKNLRHFRPTCCFTISGTATAAATPPAWVDGGG